MTRLYMWKTLDFGSWTYVYKVVRVNYFAFNVFLNKKVQVCSMVYSCN